MPIDKEYTYTLRFPAGGVNRRAPFVGDKLYTSYDSLNVILDDPVREQERGGSRPGIQSIMSTGGAGGGAAIGEITGKVRAISSVGWKASGTNNRALIWASGQSIKIESGSSFSTIAANLKDHGRTTITELNQKAYVAKDTEGYVLEVDPVGKTANRLEPGENEDGTKKGEVPVGCNIVATWRSRLILADGDDPTEIFMSRIGDPYDWDYTKKDSARAIKLSATWAGITPQPVRACIPNTDDCMIIGCDQQIWVLRGDPAVGGTVENLSDEIGILDSKSWCKTPDSSLIICSQDGVYWMPPGCGSPFTSVSREVLPKELQGLDRNYYSVSMAYDQPSRMIFLFCSKETRSPGSSSGDGQRLTYNVETSGSEPQFGGELITNHFAIDIRLEKNGDITHPRSASFWPLDFNSGSEPFACHSRYQAGKQPHAVMGTRGGSIKSFEWKTETDDTVDYESYVIYGPFGMNENMDMMLKRIEVTLGKDSNPCNIECWAFDDPEEIENIDIASPPFVAEVTNQIRNFKQDVRLRGKCFYIFVRSVNKKLWSIDKINVTVASLGRSRIHSDPVTTSHTPPTPTPTP